MICKYCGKEIPDDASYCSSCGKRTASHMRVEDRDEDIDDYEYEEVTMNTFLELVEDRYSVRKFDKGSVQVVHIVEQCSIHSTPLM